MITILEYLSVFALLGVGLMAAIIILKRRGDVIRRRFIELQKRDEREDRRSGETIIIDHDIEVTVLDINGSQVDIGVEVPETVTIPREELINYRGS